MLLLLAVVQIEDAPALSEKLLEQGLRLTKINSTGGLFGVDSMALLLGLDESRYDDVIAAIIATCKTRNVHMSSVAMLDPTFLYLTPMEVEVGGAVVFCVPVAHFVQIPEDPATPSAAGDAQANGARLSAQQVPADEEGKEMTISEAQESPQREAGGGKHMKLIVAIVKGDDADEVIRALLAAGHRLTRINTTGGFLRRGNATLLIGVESHQVDELINLIQAACPRRTEPAPLEKGLPEYSANVFVLDASHFIRV
jgi:uncharacterized protein YaaQ